jgi:hypothetical protein
MAASAYFFNACSCAIIASFEIDPSLPKYTNVDVSGTGGGSGFAATPLCLFLRSLKNNNRAATATTPSGMPTAAPTMIPVWSVFCGVEVEVGDICDCWVGVVTATGEVEVTDVCNVCEIIRDVFDV